MPGWGVSDSAEEAYSLDAVVDAEIRNGARPGSQAPHAPPALTFGLPGKQSVNRGQAGCDLIRLLRSLPVIRKVLAINELGSDRFQPSTALYYFCVRLSANAI
jgi:hypothetical protein